MAPMSPQRGNMEGWRGDNDIDNDDGNNEPAEHRQ